MPANRMFTAVTIEQSMINSNIGLPRPVLPALYLLLKLIAFYLLTFLFEFVFLVGGLLNITKFNQLKV